MISYIEFYSNIIDTMPNSSCASLIPLLVRAQLNLSRHEPQSKKGAQGKAAAVESAVVAITPTAENTVKAASLRKRPSCPEEAAAGDASKRIHVDSAAHQTFSR